MQRSSNVLCWLLAALFLSATDACAQLTSNLVAFWELEEASGTRNDGHASNHLTDLNSVGSTTGKVGTAADLESTSSQRLYIADNADLSVGDIDFSGCFWTNPESLSGFPSPFSKDTITVTADREYGAYIDGTTLYFYVFDTGGSFKQTSSGITLSTGTWQFVCFGHSASANEIWISKNTDTPITTAHSSGVRDAGAPFAIGGGLNGTSPTGDSWDGAIDQFGFWKRDVRSDISTMHNGGAGMSLAAMSGGGGPPTVRRLMTLGVGE
ncbi:MAG TPA: LamG-like jellyroll fold domain-containing protein [Vicinamibacterales bacterium]|nr:LamG-like jellyroll fold domain-containing protein [Vicinamibacterales bacterium]